MILLTSYVAALSAITGRALTAGKTNRLRFFGFISYILGSVLWITYSTYTDQYALMIQNIILIGFSIVGLKNNYENTSR